MKTVVIFGGSGFVARHIVRQLAKNGCKIIVLYQQSTAVAKLRLLGSLGQIIPIKYKSLDEEIIIKQLKQATAIINLKTSWDEKKISFQDSIFRFNKRLTSHIITNNKKCQFIFFSGLGIHSDTQSRRSKAVLNSEQYFQNFLPNCVIVRSGIIIGGEDHFLKSLIPMFKMSLFIPLFGSGLTKFQPVFIGDVTKAIDNIILQRLQGQVQFEFVGNEIYTYKEFYNLIAYNMGKKKYLIPVPFNIAKLIIFIMNITPFSPITNEQLKLFQRDNIASNNFKNLMNIGISAQNLREKLKKIIEKNL